MPNPAGAGGALGPEDRNEFIEIYNAGPRAVDLHDWVVFDGDAADRLVAWEDSSLLGSAPNVVVGRSWLRPGGFAVVLDSEYCSPFAVGGFVQPYQFGDSTLVLTTRNTTLGNGLATTDPLWLVSPYGETVSSFGARVDSGVGFPRDPGAGVSWERVWLERPDSVGNWLRSVDERGCTPGRANSAGGLVNLAAGLGLDSGSGPVRGCTARVVNRGTASVDGWRLRVWLDRDGDGGLGAGEEVALFPGVPVAPGETVVRPCLFSGGPGAADLWASVECAGDRDTGDNRCRVRVVPGGAGALRLELAAFSPDGDGFEDALAVFCRLGGTGGRLAVEVCDMAGRSVRTLFRDRAGLAELRLEWDGRDDSGRHLATGVYAVRLEYDHRSFPELVRLPVVLLRSR